MARFIRGAGYLLIAGGILFAAVAYTSSQDDDRMTLDETETGLTADVLSPGDAEITPGSSLRDGRFFFHWVANKCLDAGLTPEPVGFVQLSRCDRGIGQIIRVLEVGSRHEVQLRAGDLCIAPANGVFDEGTVLELGACSSTLANRWVLDGDSLRPSGNLDVAVAPLWGRGAVGTPLVLVRRRYAETEIWTARHAKGGLAPLHSGFISASTADELVRALENARPNTVVDVIGSIEMGAHQNVHIRVGVTLRSRSRVNGELSRITFRPDVDSSIVRPNIFIPNTPIKVTLFRMTGDRSRITSIRLIGPSSNTSKNHPWGTGVFVPRKVIAVIDRSDLSAWSHAAVRVSNDDDLESCGKILPRGPAVQIVRNYIHDNRMNSRGYGVVAIYGGYPEIRENTFDGNRHAIAADGRAHTGYDATGNLVLTSAPKQWYGYTHDFDMHGRDSRWGVDYQQGVAGQEVHIHSNTFLATNRKSLKLRGDPCFRGFFSGNMVRQARRAAVGDTGEKGIGEDLAASDNLWSFPDPTRVGIASGDFGCDGVDDLFMATGAHRYYAPGARAPWRSLGSSTVSKESLRFGDFDADGRTDVLEVRSSGFFVSWGGMSAPEHINTLTAPIEDLLVGDFDGDGAADVFYADGSEWRISPSGRGPWTEFARSGHRARNLRIGFFNDDQRSDVLGIVDGNWAAVFGGVRTWTPLRRQLSDRLGIIADFNGDGISDMLLPNAVDIFSSAISYGARSEWTVIDLTVSARDAVNASDAVAPCTGLHRRLTCRRRRNQGAHRRAGCSPASGHLLLADSIARAELLVCLSLGSPSRRPPTGVVERPAAALLSEQRREGGRRSA